MTSCQLSRRPALIGFSFVCSILEASLLSITPSYIMEKWQEPFGDMRQELVFIGQNMDQKRMIDALDNCLLSEAQVLDGMEAWRQLPDPFPAWE